MSTPGQVADGQLADLEVKYQTAKSDYDTKVAGALAMTTGTDVNTALTGVLAAKQKMMDILNQMVAITTQVPNTNLDSKRRELLDRLHDLERQYNLLSASDDQLKTLQRIRDREEEKFEGPFLVYSGLFILGCLGLAGAMVMKAI
uniref:Uncharacterized protein n=1 Tax=viral metagenome TaxID=1070528 RepID=A0A6C0JGG7_9ZZZZ